METCTRNLEKFQEYEQCTKLIEDVHFKLSDCAEDDKSRSETERLVETFRKIIDKYQEQSELLEPYLPELISKLTSDLSAHSVSNNRYHTVFKLLYQLVKVTGFKSIGKRFPHETDKLPLLVDLLSKEDLQDKMNWQTRFVLTVWLSIAILAPFDLVKFDAGSTDPDSTLSERIYSVLLRSLSIHDSCQHVTAYCLARFFSRPDVLASDQHVSKFIDSALKEVAQIKLNIASSTDDLKPIGYLRTLAYMFKFLPRIELKKRCGPILDTIVRLDIEKINRELVNHLIIKLTQRVGMALLPKRVASWRHLRGARILGSSLASGSAKPASEHIVVANQAHPGKNTQSGGNNDDNNQQQELDDNEVYLEETKVAEYLEAILSILFVACQNGQTRIRWSAAKGIARLSSRLSRERASEVLDMVLSSFFDPISSSEFAWHGGCLTLAEMSRNGLILEERLSQVTRVISEAIIYDKIKGSFAVGSHIREAACYVFWAMARTYEDSLLEAYIPTISVNLLCTMLFDRELQCRRAASATFQELVGRQGTFSAESIDILTSVDYQNVGIRQVAYVKLASEVAKNGPSYWEPFIEHLITRKIGHWDVQIRRLASDSLAALMAHPSEQFIRQQVLPRLCQLSGFQASKQQQSEDNNLKHGAILSLAKVVRASAEIRCLNFANDVTAAADNKKLAEAVGALTATCEKQLKSKQQAANFYEALTMLIVSAEVAKLKFATDGADSQQQQQELLGQWESIALAALDSDNADLRELASEALLSLYRYFYGHNKTCQDRLLTVLNKSLASANESSRCGALRALSKLGQTLDKDTDRCVMMGGEIKLDADTPDIVLMSLTSYISKTTREPAGEYVFAQAKAEACEAFVSFVRHLSAARIMGSSQLIGAGLQALLEKTEDYTFDKRGDIGVVVRRAAIKALHEIILYLEAVGAGGNSLLGPERMIKIIAKTLQQAVSYNNSAREQAALAFYKLVCQLPAEKVAHHDEIVELFTKFGALNDEQFNWRDDSTGIFVNLLSKREYARDLWLGLMPAIGQASDLCAKQFRDAISQYIIDLQGDPSQREQVFETFLETLERADLPQRLVTSGLVATDYLLTQGLMVDTTEAFQMRLVEFCKRCSAKTTQPPTAAAEAGGPAADQKRLVSVGRVACAMLQFSGQAQLASLQLCLKLLISGYPKVRASLAEELYSNIITYQTDLEVSLPDGCQLETAMELLSKTNWFDGLDKVRPVRDQICALLKVAP